MKYLQYFILALSLVFTVSCSEEPPEIFQVFWQLNIMSDKVLNDTYEQLTLFLHVDDKDGIDDVESIYIIKDEEELFWKINHENWIKSEKTDETWLGSNKIIMPDYSPFPRGDYRLLLIDKAGERDEKEFYISKGSIKPPIDFPKAVIEDKIITIKSPYKENTLWIYSENDELLEICETGTGNISLDRIFKSNKKLKSVSYIYVYAYSSTRGHGLISGPYLY